MKESVKRKFVLILFAIAMGILEAAVVVYLRILYYPTGELFPLQDMPSSVLLVEVIREAATVLMLWGVAYLFGKNSGSRFGAFLIAFGVWDIIYYIFLKAFISWPADIMEWDVLFLIPTVWVGPVWAPCLLAAIMIGFGFILLYFNEASNVRLKAWDWIFLILGSLVSILSFSLDYLRFAKSQLSGLSGSSLFDIGHAFSHSYIPEHFPLPVFALGVFFILLGIFNYLFRNYIPSKTIKNGQWI